MWTDLPTEMRAHVLHAYIVGHVAEDDVAWSRSDLKMMCSRAANWLQTHRGASCEAVVACRSICDAYSLPTTAIGGLHFSGFDHLHFSPIAVVSCVGGLVWSQATYMNGRNMWWWRLCKQYCDYGAFGGLEQEVDNAMRNRCNMTYCEYYYNEVEQDTSGACGFAIKRAESAKALFNVLTMCSSAYYGKGPSPLRLDIRNRYYKNSMPEYFMACLRMAVAVDGAKLRFATPEMLKNRSFMLVAVQTNGDALEKAPDNLRDDFALVRMSVAFSGITLMHASARLRGNHDIVLTAATQDMRALHYATAACNEDAAFMARVEAAVPV